LRNEWCGRLGDGRVESVAASLRQFGVVDLPEGPAWKRRRVRKQAKTAAFQEDDNDVTFSFGGVEVTARANHSERAALFVKADPAVLTTLFEAFKKELADGEKKPNKGPLYSSGGFKVYTLTFLDIRSLVVVAIMQLHHCDSGQWSCFQFGLPHLFGDSELPRIGQVFCCGVPRREISQVFF
jgi:hypothetical protein